MPENISSPESELQALCLDWQRRLRLQDWTVRATWARYWELNGVAHVAYVTEAKTAHIKVIVPEDYRSDEDLWPYVPEQSLVHELLHLHFAPFDTERGSPLHIAEEQAVAAMAEALVTLKRENTTDG